MYTVQCELEEEEFMWLNGNLHYYEDTSLITPASKHTGTQQEHYNIPQLDGTADTDGKSNSHFTMLYFYTPPDG